MFTINGRPCGVKKTPKNNAYTKPELEDMVYENGIIGKRAARALSLVEICELIEQNKRKLNVSVRKSPTRSPVRKTSTSRSPARKTSTSRSPARKTSTSRSPARKTSTSRSPARKTSTSRSPARKTSSKKLTPIEKKLLKTQNKEILDKLSEDEKNIENEIRSIEIKEEIVKKKLSRSKSAESETKKLKKQIEAELLKAARDEEKAQEFMEKANTSKRKAELLSKELEDEPDFSRKLEFISDELEEAKSKKQELEEKISKLKSAKKSVLTQNKLISKGIQPFYTLKNGKECGLTYNKENPMRMKKDEVIDLVVNEYKLLTLPQAKKTSLRELCSIAYFKDVDKSTIIIEHMPEVIEQIAEIKEIVPEIVEIVENTDLENQRDINRTQEILEQVLRDFVKEQMASSVKKPRSSAIVEVLEDEEFVKPEPLYLEASESESEEVPVYRPSSPIARSPVVIPEVKEEPIFLNNNDEEKKDVEQTTLTLTEAEKFLKLNDQQSDEFAKAMIDGKLTPKIVAELIVKDELKTNDVIKGLAGLVVNN